MTTIIEKLQEIKNGFEGTSEQFENAQDLYDYTLADEELSEATMEDCERLF